MEHAARLARIVLMRLDDDHVRTYLCGDALELLCCFPDRGVNNHAGPRTEPEGAAKALKLPLRVLDMGARTNVCRVHGAFDLLAEWVRMNDVHDVNLGLVDRSDESARLGEQVLADVA
jgi:hypothetical protein